MSFSMSFVLLACVLLAPWPARAQTLRGRVLDVADGRPLAHVHVPVLRADRDTALLSAAAPEGAFQFQLDRAGAYRLRAELLGYTTLTTEPVTLSENQVLTLELRLDRDAIPLTPTRVVAERIEPMYMADLRRRQRKGFGRYILREELDERSTSRLEDVLALPGGLRISYRRVPVRGESGLDTLSGPLVPLVAARQAGMARECFASVYVNGHPIFTAELLDNPLPEARQATLERLHELFFLRPDDFEAVEIYRGAAQVPAEFSGSASQCGVVALWTRGGFGWRAEEDLPAAPPVRFRAGVSGANYRLSGTHAPGPGTAIEAAAWFVTTPRLSSALFLRYGAPVMSARTASYLTSVREGDANDVGPRRLLLLALGAEPRVSLARIGPVRPAVTARGLVAYRRFSVEPTAHDPGRTHASAGWGFGVGAVVEVDVWHRLTGEVAYGRDWLHFGEYSNLEEWWRRTASTWTATSLRVGLTARL
ncbi:hypothetical protein BH23GEM9_BH23GEM9_03170 [soil metagenome]